MPPVPAAGPRTITASCNNASLLRFGYIYEERYSTNEHLFYSCESRGPPAGHQELSALPDGWWSSSIVMQNDWARRRGFVELYSCRCTATEQTGSTRHVLVTCIQPTTALYIYGWAVKNIEAKCQAQRKLTRYLRYGGTERQLATMHDMLYPRWIGRRLVVQNIATRTLSLQHAATPAYLQPASCVKHAHVCTPCWATAYNFLQRRVVARTLPPNYYPIYICIYICVKYINMYIQI